MPVVEPLAQGQGRGTVHEGAPHGREDALRGDEVPDVPAQRGQQEADAGEKGAAQGGGLAVAGPALGEGGEEQGHGEVHDAVEGGADDSGEALVAC